MRQFDLMYPVRISRRVTGTLKLKRYYFAKMPFCDQSIDGVEEFRGLEMTKSEFRANSEYVIELAILTSSPKYRESNYRYVCFRCEKDMQLFIDSINEESKLLAVKPGWKPLR